MIRTREEIEDKMLELQQSANRLSFELIDKDVRNWKPLLVGISALLIAVAGIFLSIYAQTPDFAINALFVSGILLYGLRYRNKSIRMKRRRGVAFGLRDALRTIEKGGEDAVFEKLDELNAARDKSDKQKEYILQAYTWVASPDGVPTQENA